DPVVQRELFHCNNDANEGIAILVGESLNITSSHSIDSPDRPRLLSPNFEQVVVEGLGSLLVHSRIRAEQFDALFFLHLFEVIEELLDRKSTRLNSSHVS